MSAQILHSFLDWIYSMWHCQWLQRTAALNPPSASYQPTIRLKLSHTCLHRLLASMLDCVCCSILFPVLTWSCYSRCCGCLLWHFNLVPMLHEFPAEAQEDLRHLIIVFCITNAKPLKYPSNSFINPQIYIQSIVLLLLLCLWIIIKHTFNFLVAVLDHPDL